MADECETRPIGWVDRCRPAAAGHTPVEEPPAASPEDAGDEAIILLVQVDDDRPR